MQFPKERRSGWFAILNMTTGKEEIVVALHATENDFFALRENRAGDDVDVGVRWKK